MHAVKLNASQKKSLLRAVEALASPRTGKPDDVVVVVIGQGQAAVRRPQALGRAPKVRDVLRWVEAAVDGCAAQEERHASTPLSAAEAALLDSAGFDAADTDGAGALERSRVEYELMMRESLSLDDAARALGVTPSRLRQRLSPAVRSIYGIKDGRSWRIPRFQFMRGGKLVRNIDKVLPHIRPDAHPLAVKTWFSTPHVDLVAGDKEVAVTPTAWLAAGRSVDAVAALAEEL